MVVRSKRAQDGLVDPCLAKIATRAGVPLHLLPSSNPLTSSLHTYLVIRYPDG